MQKSALQLMALLIVMAGSVLPNPHANAETLVERLREGTNLSSDSIDWLAYVLELRRDNRSLLDSLDVKYTEAVFLSPHRLRQLSEDSSGVVPTSAIPNPQLRQVHFMKHGNTMYARVLVPSRIQSHYIPDREDAFPIVSSYRPVSYAPVRVDREFVDTGDRQMSRTKETVLADDDLSLARGGEVAAISEDGSLRSVVWQDVFTPEIHERITLERFASGIASGSGAIEDVSVNTNEDGKRVLTVVSTYDWPWDEIVRATYSLDDNGLLIQRESVAYETDNNGKTTTRTITIQDVSFAEFETDKGRIVLPTIRLYTFEVNGELREQHLLMVDVNSLRVNQEIPMDSFRVTFSKADISFNHTYNLPEDYTPDSPSPGPLFYRNIDELPAGFAELTRIADSSNGYSSAEHFSPDEGWDEIFLAFGGTGGGGSPPFGNVELAKYAQNPHPRVYSSASAFWWLNNLDAITTALIGGLLMILLGITARNLVPRRTRQTAAQSM